MSLKNLLALLLVSSLAACDWVDSTGREFNSAPVTQISFADGEQTEASQIDELKSRVLSVSAIDSDGSVNRFEWNPEPVRQGKLSQCAALPDFDMDLAADSLETACASDANCRVTIEKQLTEGDAVDFLFAAPKLKAHVGVTFELSAVDNEGGTGRQQSTFCLIAINEAPDAGDDSFTVLEGETLVVTSDDVNLLSNDKDDEHVGNGDSLRVLIEPDADAPLPDSLTLEENGGFTYVASLLSDRRAEEASVKFDYTVTDGSQSSNATVTIRILAKNDPPEQLAAIPPQQVVAGIPFESDLSTYFDDAEGATLSFALSDGSLPPSGGLTLSSTGLLSGDTELLDIGSYPVQLIASDGSATANANFTILVEDNLPVAAVSIVQQNVKVGDMLLLDVSDSFDDPENQPLFYSVESSFDDAELVMNSSTGILSASFEDIGRFIIDVSASDGVVPASSIRFVVIVSSDNVTPVFRGRITDQIIDLGDPLSPIAGTFVDGNADVLSYSVVGRLPIGASINPNTGLITGRPTEAGLFTGIRIVATDPFDEFARSNAFAIQVTAPPVAPVNSAPEFGVRTSVFNQGIALGQPIQPLLPDFTDADNDVLSYRVIGATLPAGVVINSVTGVISGTPTQRGRVTGLSVLATDPSGASAESAIFWIVVR